MYKGCSVICSLLGNTFTPQVKVYSHATYLIYVAGKVQTVEWAIGMGFSFSNSGMLLGNYCIYSHNYCMSMM